MKLQKKNEKEAITGAQPGNAYWHSYDENSVSHILCLKRAGPKPLKLLPMSEVFF